MALVIGIPFPQTLPCAPAGAAACGRRMMERTEIDAQDIDRWQELLAGVRRGDAAAERRMVEDLYPRVAGIVLSLRPRRDQVEDLAQEVFLRVFSRLGQHRGGSFTAWVDAIARRVCYDALRKQKVRPEWRFADLPEDPAEPVDEGDGVAPRESAELLERMFSRIDPAQAWLLREVELVGRSSDEVAEEMGWTRLAARLRLMRARRALEKCYEAMKKEGLT
jgi:RNA polymerase sigma-70 factor (ECF subfamily)